MFDFDDWLDRLEQSIRGLAVPLQLSALASQANRDFEAVLWFVRIHGKRWSHVAGELPSRPECGCIKQIVLHANFGVVIQSRGHLSDTDLKSLIEFINSRILKGVLDYSEFSIRIRSEGSLQ